MWTSVELSQAKVGGVCLDGDGAWFSPGRVPAGGWGFASTQVPAKAAYFGVRMLQVYFGVGKGTVVGQVQRTRCKCYILARPSKYSTLN